MSLNSEGGDQTTNQENQQDDNQDNSVTFKVGDREYDVNSAAKKISSADEHITKIQEENKTYQTKLAELEAQVNQSLKLEEALAKLNSKKDNESGEQDDKGNTTSIDPEKLSELVKQTTKDLLKEEENAKLEVQRQTLSEETLEATKKALADTYGGPNVDKAIKEAGIEGLDVDKAMEMAKDPTLSKVLLKLMNVSHKKNISPSSDINSYSLQNNQKKSLYDKPASQRTSKDIAAKLIEMQEAAKN